MEMITLQPVTMVTFNCDGIYAPSKILKSIKIPDVEFLEKYADHPNSLLISFEKDGISNPQLTTIVGGRFIVVNAETILYDGYGIPYTLE